ncbi:hypothetical protein [Kamptonema sp. UHCC 0994]|uniref:hypothetical protein n=1 Tax=Kamptonema sp. UHCC 0994 TaxID=3031329 RepID=UPI0023BA2644|nr:hypothetical protein [Kamptonema sp. UHCC 0994]MDF0552520.1 hypothetical protein [Kamptonema sp. UHCC 0994]
MSKFNEKVAIALFIVAKNQLQNQKQQLTENAIPSTLKLTTGGFLCKTPSLALSRKPTSNGNAPTDGGYVIAPSFR